MYAIITGVSSGLGAAMAKFFAARDVNVIGISRSEPAEDVRQILHAWISGDITNADDRARIVAETGTLCDGKLDLLINNAGKGIYATWEEMDENELREVFELDFFAMVALTKAFLPQLAAAHGSIVNISSAAGRLWVPCMGAYCAAKAAVSMFSNSLRVEVKKMGIHVLDVSPGQINTGFSSRSCGSRRPPDSPGAKGHSPNGLAKAVFRAWRRKKKRITYPGKLAFLIFLVRVILPNLYDRISLKLWKLQD